MAAAVEDLDGFDPDVTDLTDRIDAVESDVDAVATTVAALPGPVDVVVTAPDPTVEETNLPTSVVTTVDGRWLVSQDFEGYALCPSASDVRFFLTIDHEPVASTIVSASHNASVRATLSGPTEGVVPAGEHELRIGAECVGPDTVAPQPSSRSKVSPASSCFPSSPGRQFAAFRFLPRTPLLAPQRPRDLSDLAHRCPLSSACRVLQTRHGLPTRFPTPTPPGKPAAMPRSRRPESIGTRGRMPSESMAESKQPYEIHARRQPATFRHLARLPGRRDPRPLPYEGMLRAGELAEPPKSAAGGPSVTWRVSSGWNALVVASPCCRTSWWSAWGSIGQHVCSGHATYARCNGSGAPAPTWDRTPAPRATGGDRGAEASGRARRRGVAFSEGRPRAASW